MNKQGAITLKNFCETSTVAAPRVKVVIAKPFYDLWRAAVTLLLLLTIATIASQPTDFDEDLHPAPFSAYDDDVVKASTGASRNSAFLTTVQDVDGDNGKLPPPLVALVSSTGIHALAASAASFIWFVSPSSGALQGSTTSPYLARAPPAAQLL